MHRPGELALGRSRPGGLRCSRKTQGGKGEQPAAADAGCRRAFEGPFNIVLCCHACLPFATSIGKGLGQTRSAHDVLRRHRPIGTRTLKVVGYMGSKLLSETMMWRRAPADLKRCHV